MMADFDKVCEEVSGTADHEEFFNKKFDQLEKLHELYKSVSSISAASQSRLELNSNLVPGQLQLQHRSASFSLTGGHWAGGQIKIINHPNQCHPLCRAAAG